MLDLRQSPEYARFLELEGWKVQKIGDGFVYLRKLPLTPFWVAKYQRPKKPDLDKFLKLTKDWHVRKGYFEPLRLTGVLQSALENYFRRSPSFLPTKTIRLDLSLSFTKIQAQMKKDGRYGIRKAKERGVKIRRGNEKRLKKLFLTTWRKTVSENHIGGILSVNRAPSSKSLENLGRAFGNKAIFLTAEKAGKTEAGAIVLETNNTAYYYRAFTGWWGRKSLAQYLVVWEAIKRAKREGCRIFDFEGIDDSRFPKKNWEGFTHFKKSFGGQNKKFPGCFVTNSRLRTTF